MVMRKVIGWSSKSSKVDIKENGSRLITQGDPGHPRPGVPVDSSGRQVGLITQGDQFGNFWGTSKPQRAFEARASRVCLRKARWLGSGWLSVIVFRGRHHNAFSGATRWHERGGLSTPKLG